MKIVAVQRTVSWKLQLIEAVDRDSTGRVCCAIKELKV